MATIRSEGLVSGQRQPIDRTHETIGKHLSLILEEKRAAREQRRTLHGALQ